MRVRTLSPTGDYQFGNGTLDFLIDLPQTVGQVVETALLLFLGEWYIDTSLGCPYFQGVLGKHTQAQADLVIQDYVLSQQGVTGIANYQSALDHTGRISTITFNLDTIYGPTPVQVQNYLLF